ncbi:nuclear transport factor 2 family protein [Necropsobacter rosorum]|uniref:nuclear transport factor 2 family protein n=1 Tax=Necropsobacter rosorum TaxID=908285 RepID=UPI0005096DED
MNEFNYTNEQKVLVDEILQLEVDALNRWFNGDVSGYREIWSKTNFSYFDIAKPLRIDSYAEIEPFLDNLDGKLFIEKPYELVSPRVQFSNDNQTGILTYQLHAKTNLIDSHYNCIEIFQKENGKWQVIHSCWAAIRPMDWDYNTMIAAV